MKKLQIKNNSWAHKLAKLGGFPEDGQVIDKEARIYNEYLEIQYNLAQISSQEYVNFKRPTWKDADFCHFVRRAMLGVFWTTVGVVAASLAVYAIFAEVVWAFQCIINWKWIYPKGPALAAFIVTCVAAFLCLCAGLKFGGDWLAQALNRRYYGKNRSRSQIKMDKLQAKLNRIEVRKAFWVTIRNKACFLLEFK